MLPSNLYFASVKQSRNIYREITRRFSVSLKCFNSKAHLKEGSNVIVGGKEYIRDDMTNVTPHVLSYLSRNLHLVKNHPISLIKRKIVSFMHGKFLNRRHNPLFSVYDELSPVVSIEQNFDSLLIPRDHPSRSKTDSYYLNSNYLLRPHTSAHQKELIRSGLDNFIVVGDVYRRDEIDSKHFPVFHQCEAVRLLSPHEFPYGKGIDEIKVFENGSRHPEKQECHTMEAVKLMEKELKDCLEGLVKRLFGSDILYKWSDSYFPFTHPSWELEVFHEGKWLEVLGCGIMEQKILSQAGAEEKIGWAFGLGLERLAMKLYAIPDIRIFWSSDSGFLSQFDVKNIDTPITFKALSKYPQCTNDISFWVPDCFHPNDFFDVARAVGGDIIEQVHKVDEFFHPKHKRMSFCYSIVYRHMERTLTQEEVNNVHKKIEAAAVKELGVEIR